MSHWMIVHNHQLLCAGCGAVQHDLYDCRHFAWCAIDVGSDGPKTFVTPASTVKTSEAAVDPGLD